MDKKYISYEEFGAVGDGVTDDIEAIIACHEEANRTSTPVKTLDGATYYIGGRKLTATIKTSVDFGTSKFIIDDTSLEDIKSEIFSVISDFPTFAPDIKTLKKGQKTVDFEHEGNVYVRAFNENRKMFIRKGLNMNSGASATDCFLVDEAGNISPSIDWDHPEITKIWARRIDDEPITIRGGIFTTIANNAESFYNYHNRGFCINRANVTVEGLTHYVTGESDHGAPYRSFININGTANVIVKDCLLTPHFIYWTPSKIPGKPVAMGSYDINIGASINVRCENITQTIDITDNRYWGIYTSNFCKNLSLTNCVISRFDAHQGVTNVAIKGCKLGHQGINLIGFGEAVIEDTEVTANALFNLRHDYGCIWDGNVTVKNCIWKPNGKNTSLFSSLNQEDHDFGYKCCQPHKFTVDGLHVYDEKLGEAPFYILPVYNKDKTDEVYPYPYATVEELTLNNITTDSGKPYAICENSDHYPGLVINE